MNSKTELLTALRINTITQTGLARQSEALESEAKALRAALAVMEAVDNETKQSPEKLSENLTDLCLQCKHCPNITGKDCGVHDRIKDDDGPDKCKHFVKLTICDDCIHANKLSCKLGQPHYTRTISGIEDCSDFIPIDKSETIADGNPGYWSAALKTLSSVCGACKNRDRFSEPPFPTRFRWYPDYGDLGVPNTPFTECEHFEKDAPGIKRKE